MDLSSASLIRRPLFHCNPIPGNADYSERDLHEEVYYDFPSFSADPELRDSMLLVQRYSLEPFMTPRQFFYPWVVIKFYHTMTSRREPHLTALHFSIEGRPGILKASNIAATFNYRWSSPTRPSIGSCPISIPERWSVFFPGTLPSDQFCSGGSSHSICFLSITFCGLTFSRFSILFRGEDPS